jgi:sterol 3beta-glucosyltransferase
MASSSHHTLSPSQQQVPRRVSKKLQKRHHGEEHVRIDIPERLRDEDEDDDADNELAPSQGPPMFMNMNQSIFGLIAAAGTRVDFTERFDGSSSEDEDGEQGKGSPSHDLSQTTALPKPQKDKKEGHHRRRVSGRLLKSLPSLPRFKSKSKREKSKLSSESTEKYSDDHEEQDSEIEPESALSDPPEIKLTREDSRLAPVMSRMLEARAEMSTRPSFDMGRGSTEVARTSEGGEVTPLAKRLMQIFEFDSPEEVIQGQSHHSQHTLCRGKTVSN